MKNKWELSEPNIKSAKRDNENNICAVGNCTNELGNPPATAFMGLKVCNECRKRMDEFLVGSQRDIDKERLSWINELIGDLTTEGN
jgi:hypothetical protein